MPGQKMDLMVCFDKLSVDIVLLFRKDWTAGKTRKRSKLQTSNQYLWSSTHYQQEAALQVNMPQILLCLI
jgi:hypothetical protein